jgi:hypothetical protein
MADAVLREKQFPGNYPKDVMKVIDAMTVEGGDIQVVGSQSLESQKYSADYDLIQTIKSKASTDTAIWSFVLSFQSMIKRLLRLSDSYIGDIKCGTVPEWELVKGTIRDGKVDGYSRSRALDTLSSMTWLTKDEIATVKKLLVQNPTPDQFFEAKDMLKFQTVRWRPSDILRGYVKLRDNRRFTLEDGFKSSGLTKIDVVAYVQSRFIDFSCIYLFETRDGIINNPVIPNIKEDLYSYALQGKWFKVAKRMFVIARSERKHDLPMLNDILNSDLGLLYSIISDCKTILYLLEEEKHIPLEKIRHEIDSFRGRIANAYNIPGANSGTVLANLLSMDQLPGDAKGRERLREKLESLVDYFERLLGNNSRNALQKKALYPIPSWYLP